MIELRCFCFDSLKCSHLSTGANIFTRTNKVQFQFNLINIFVIDVGLLFYYSTFSDRNACRSNFIYVFFLLFVPSICFTCVCTPLHSIWPQYQQYFFRLLFFFFCFDFIRYASMNFLFCIYLISSFDKNERYKKWLRLYIFCSFKRISNFRLISFVFFLLSRISR